MDASKIVCENIVADKDTKAIIAFDLITPERNAETLTIGSVHYFKAELVEHDGKSSIREFKGRITSRSIEGARLVRVHFNNDLEQTRIEGGIAFGIPEVRWNE